MKQNYFRIISQDYCSSQNVAEIILKQFQNSFSGRSNFISASDVINVRNKTTKFISKLFQNYFISHVTMHDGLMLVYLSVRSQVEVFSVHLQDGGSDRVVLGHGGLVL